jgi:hypothetical protein
MLCGRCKKPIICEDCLVTEQECLQEQDKYHKHKFTPTECECESIPRYIGQDIMWNIKSVFEAIIIFIFVACFLGFIISFFTLWFIPSWLENVHNTVFAISVCVGVVDIFFMAAWESDWREDYRDRSTITNIREKIDK